MLWLLVSVAAFLCFLHWVIMSGKDAQLFSKIPGPKGHPILFNILDIITNPVDLFYLQRKWSSEYKNIFRIWVPPFRAINIYNPDDIETIISTPKFNDKNIIYKLIEPWLNEGLLLSNGQKWFTRRKILTPAFHFNILRHFSHILEENSWRMVQDLEIRLHEKQTNLVPLISAFSLHCICETAMGTKLNEDKTGSGIKYKKAVYEIGEILFYRFTRIWLVLDFIFNLTTVGKKQKKILQTIKSFPKQVIDERRNYLDQYRDDLYIEGSTEDDDIHMNKGKTRMAMLDLLLSAEKQGLIDADGIQEEVDTFMFEGHDTTAMALIFGLMLLANHKDVQDKVVDELEIIFHGSDRPAKMTDLQQMKFLDCCIKETLRLYPSVPLISRQIGEEVQLQEYRVPGGTLCHIHIFDLHRREDLFPEPLEFQPDRFLSENCLNRHPYAYIPFSAGPRNCIGQKFAMLEMKSAISAILRTYQLLPVTKPEDIVFTSDLVLRAVDPIYVKFSKRR